MTTNIDYFESDQIKFALVLWKVAKKARQPDFDVLKFSHQWAYADTILQQLMLSDDAITSQHAIELMQLRILFVQKFPDRAKQMGAVFTVPNADSTNGTATTRDAATPDRLSTSAKPGQTPLEPNGKRYLKGVR